MTTKYSAPARVWRAWATAALCAVTLMGCGGGGGGGTGGSGGSPGGGAPAPTLSADIYPLASGDRRSWRMTAGSTVGAIRHERVGEAVGAALIVRSSGNDLQQPTDDEYLQRSATGIASVAGPTSDALTRAVGSVDLLRFGSAQGQAVVLLDRSLSVDVDGDGRADAVDLHIESQFVGNEAVTTTLAAFAEASHVRTSIRSTIRLAGTSTSHTIAQTVDDWYVAAIGPVRTTSSTVSDGGAAVVETEEVVAYSVGTRRSESVAPTVAQALPQNDSLSRPDIELRLVFSEPIDPLSLRGDTGFVLLLDGAPLAPQSLQLSADAKTLTIFPKTYPIADGRYELRNGGQVSDWAGNPAPTLLSSFRVDTRGPRLQASTPTDGAADVALTGTLTFDFDEAVVVPAGVELRVFIQPEAGGASQTLAATLQGSRIVATLGPALQPNTAYLATIGAGLTDAAGNAAAGVAVRFRTDPGAFGRPLTWASDLQVRSVMVADVDGDGRGDVVFTALVPGGSELIGVRLQQADGRYAAVRPLFTFPTYEFCGLISLAVADMDGDGKADVMVHGGCNYQAPLRLLRQRPDGSFAAEVVPINLQGPLVAMDSGILGLNSQGLTRVNRQADGSWQQTVLAPTSTFDVHDWRLVDLDGDGRPDLVWVQSNTAGDGFALGWQLRKTTGWGPLQSRPLLAGRPTALATGDFDGDGRPDVVIAVDNGASGPASNGELWVLKQNAAGGFADPLRLPSAWGASALLVEDFNGDGRADIAVAHDTIRRTGIYLQAPAGGLDAERLFESGYGYFGERPMAWLDLTGDGLKDLVQGELVLPGRAFSGPWPLGAMAPVAQAQSAGRLLRATSAAAAGR